MLECSFRSKTRGAARPVRPTSPVESSHLPQPSIQPPLLLPEQCAALRSCGAESRRLLPPTTAAAAIRAAIRALTHGRLYDMLRLLCETSAPRADSQL